MAEKYTPTFYFTSYNSTLESLVVGESYDASQDLKNLSGVTPVTWSTSDPTVVSVDENGIITVHQAGSVTLYAHSDESTYFYEANAEKELNITTYPISILKEGGWVDVTPSTASNIDGKGHVSYDYSTHTLTLNNWTNDFTSITDFSTYIGGAITYILDNQPLTIRLIGTNTITCGQFCSANTLIFSGADAAQDKLIVNSIGHAAISASNQLTIDNASLVLNETVTTLHQNQDFTDPGVFYADKLSVVNGGNLHATVTGNESAEDCPACLAVGVVSSALVGDITTPNVIWTADAASESSIYSSYQSDMYNGYFFDDQGGEMLPRELEIGLAVDPRKVPDLKFDWNYITEATIIKDVHGWVYAPGTASIPQTTYPVYVYEDFDGNGYYYVKQPSELDLEMTYSVTTSAPSDPNKDVITLTNTTGDYFEFDYQAENINYGDVVITASTEGNEEYQPASATFTIHVINGKGAERECVLKYVAGPYAGQLVPAADEFDNLQTGDEVHMEWMRLVEKNYPDVVYAPSHSIWGSEKYYIACRESELKLRALTAGDDKFTVKYARYEDGDANGNFQVIEIPVHIKPSQPALVSSLDLSSATLQDQNVVFNAVYDQAAHEAQLAGTLTTQQVLDVMNSTNYNSQVWRDNLPQTISFELAGGKGSFEVNCNVQPGYEVRIIQYGDTKANHIITSSTPQPYVVNYDIPNQRAVVIFVAVAGSSNPAPKRAPASKNDAPIATLSALNMNPTYPLSANLDPDHAGVYYSTHYNETQKYQLPVGTEAYVATISNTGDLNMTKVAEGGQVIPANTAFILKSNAASVVLTPTDAEPVTISASNDLIGTDSEKAAPANCYVLSGHSADDSVTGVGFYQFTGTLAAHKAYAIYSGGASLAPAHRMRFIFNNEQTVTGIENAQNSDIRSQKVVENGQLVIIKNGVRYNAQGQIVK